MEDKRATKLTEKIFTIYDDTKAAQKSKKRIHIDEKEKDKDAKKPKLQEDELKNDAVVETQLSPDKVSILFYRTRIFLNVIPIVST